MDVEIFIGKVPTASRENANKSLEIEALSFSVYFLF